MIIRNYHKDKSKFQKFYINSALIFTFVVIFSQQVNIVSAGTGINQQIPYSGSIVNNAGVAWPNGNKNMKFEIYNVASGGTPIYTQIGDISGTPTGTVKIEDGRFDVLLGSVTALPTLNDDSLYLQISMDDDNSAFTGVGGYEEVFSPRRRIGSALSAINALRLVAANGGTNTGTLSLDISGNVIATGSSMVGTSEARINTKFLSVNGAANTNADYGGSAGAFVGPGLIGSGANSATVSIEDNRAMAVDQGGVIGFGGRYVSGSPAYANWANIAGRKENGINSNYGGYLAFFTRPNLASPTERLRITSAGNVGIGTTQPATALDINGAESMRGMAEPAVSPAGQGRIYFDSTANTYRVSQNAGAYINLGALSSLNPARATNSINNLNFAQTWNWTTASTQTPLSVNTNALTTGSILSLATSNASVNSTNGLLYVANTGAATTGTIARIQSNSTAGSGLTVFANGNVAIGGTDTRGVLTVQKDFATPIFNANTDMGDQGRTFVMQNNNTTNAANQFSNITLQINPTGGIGSGRVLGDIRLVRETANQTNSYFIFSALRQDGTYKDFTKIGFNSSYFVGNVGIGTTAPTARLTLGAGTATANTSPLKFSAGTNLTTAEAGALEWDGTNLFLTTSGAVRQTINQGLTATATLDFPSTANDSFSTLTIAIANAALNDVVSLGLPDGSVPAAATNFSAWVSAANTVTVRFTNNSGVAQDPASGSFKVFVTK